MLKKAEKPNIPSIYWVEAITIRAWTLVALTKIEDAIKTLKQICFILPPMPSQKMNYIDNPLAI